MSTQIVVNSMATTEKVQKVSVVVDRSLCNLGIDASLRQLFEDEHRSGIKAGAEFLTNLCVSGQISALIREFEDGAVVAEGTPGAEGAYGGEDVAEGRLAGGGCLQALIAEKFTSRILRLGDAVGD